MIQQRQHGFTLIEILIVVVILSILAIAVGQLRPFADEFLQHYPPISVVT